MTADFHVPQRRIIERVSRIPGVEPLRIFPLLLPLWEVEARTILWDAQPYEVFDQHLSRAIGRAGLREMSRLADFFAVEPALAERAVGFLQSIGHVTRDGDVVTLTALGDRSLRAGCRYVRKEDRQMLYFDGFTGAPLPAEHYDNTVWLNEPELTLRGVKFHVVTGSPTFTMSNLDDLARRPDRHRFNLPADLTELEALQVSVAWLPAYVVECTKELLVFIKAFDGADPYLSRLVAPFLRNVLAMEPKEDELRLWRDWLAYKKLPDVPLIRLANRVLRVSFPGEVFSDGLLEWWRLGSFESRRHSFLQVWCDNDEARRTAVLKRVEARIAARYDTTAEAIGELLSEMAAALDVSAPTVEDFERHLRGG